MKVIILLVVFISYKSFLFCQIEPVISTAVINNMCEAVGFYIGQSLTLQHIKNNYKDLEQLSEVLRLKFDNKFRSSFVNMDLIISKEFSDWDKIKAKMGGKLNSMLGLDDLSKEDAINFLEEVNMRLEGDIPSPIAETILSFHPLYLNNPPQEFIDNFKKRYSSEENKKAKGLKFHIDFPQSWIAEDGNRPNIVKKMISQNGYGFVTVTLLVKELPDLNISNLDELKKLLPLNEVGEMLPLNSKLIAADYTKIDNVPALWYDCKIIKEQNNESFMMKSKCFHIFYQNKMLFVGFAVGNKEQNEVYIDSSFKLCKILFKSIVNSIVIFNQWENN